MATIDLKHITDAIAALRALADVLPSQVQADPSHFGRLQGRAISAAINLEVRLPSFKVEITKERAE